MHQFVVVPGLGDEVGGTVLQSLHGQAHIGVGSQQYDRRLRVLLADGAKPEESLVAVVHAEGEVHVEQHDVDGLLRHQFQYVVRLGCGQHLLESAIEQIAHRRENRCVVVYNQNRSVLVHAAKVIIFRQEIIQ